MALYDIARESALKIYSAEKNITKNIADKNSRNTFKLIQFISMKKKENRNICGKYRLTNEQKEQIDELYKKNYGKK